MLAFTALARERPLFLCGLLLDCLTFPLDAEGLRLPFFESSGVAAPLGVCKSCSGLLLAFGVELVPALGVASCCAQLLGLLATRSQRQGEGGAQGGLARGALALGSTLRKAEGLAGAHGRRVSVFGVVESGVLATTDCRFMVSPVGESTFTYRGVKTTTYGTVSGF